MQYKKYIPDVIGLVVLTALIGALIAALSIFDLLMWSLRESIGGIIAIYLVWAAMALYAWHDDPPTESESRLGKWVGKWGSWGMYAVLSVALAVLWYGGNRLIEALFIPGEHENSKAFDTLVALISCPGFTFIYIAGYVRELFQKKIAPPTQHAGYEPDHIPIDFLCAQSVSFIYDAANRTTGYTLPNGITATLSYDNANQLLSIAYSNGQSSLGGVSYTYDANGRRSAAGGTLLSMLAGSVVSTTTFDANNRLTSWGNRSLTYDANGNLTSDGINTYTWDERGQLSSITGAANASFMYDGQGRRVSKTIGGMATRYVYDGVNVAQVAQGNKTTSFLNGLGVDENYGQLSSSKSLYPLTDALGSTLALTNTTGAVTGRYSYDPYGASIASGGDSTDWQYTGRENDGTGLYYYRARYYNPTYGRFISEDPIGWDAGQTNLYGYVRGNPLSYNDAFGLARKRGKKEPTEWPKLPLGVCGKKPKWNSEGYWEGKGRKLTWDDRSHGAGVDRGNGPQGGHWDDENSDNRWDENGRLLPGSQDAKSTSVDWNAIGLGAAVIGAGAAAVIIAPGIAIPALVIGGAAAR